jgi:putative ABC transport system permease protein
MARGTQTHARVTIRDRAHPRVDPLWAKAPFLLLRYPGLFASIAVGAALLALAAAAYPLFISASASELLAVKVEDPLVTSWGAGFTYRNRGMPLPGNARHPEVFERTDSLFRELTGPNPYLDPTAVSILGPIVEIAEATAPDETREVRIYAGDGASAEVEIVEGEPGSGALVPDTAAEALGIEPGDRIVLGSQRGGTASIEVDGIYRSLYKGGASGYWGTWFAELIDYCADCAPPPQPLVLSEPQFLEMASALRVNNAGTAWMAPLAEDLSLEQAEDAAARAAGLVDRMSDRQTATGRLFSRCYLAGFCGVLAQATFGSSISDVVTDVQRRVAAVESPAKLLRAAGILVALAVVAAAGAFAMAARRVESALLFARGARPATVAGRAMLEAALPSLVGVGAGLGLAFALVLGIGPNGAIASGASSQALRAALAGAVVAVVAIGIVSAVSFLRQSEHHRGRFRVLLALPWELVLIGLSFLVLDRLRDGGAIVVNETLRAETPSLLLLAFPVLFLAGFVTLVARVAMVVVRWLRGRSDRFPTVPYLAVHRMAARPGLTLMLVAGAGLCLGLFAQAQTVAGSMQTTVDAKARVYVGSDVQARIGSINATPADFPLPLTRVVRELQAGEFHTGLTFDLLVIDPGTFEAAAFWDQTFAPEPLEALVGRLDRDAETGLPVVLAAWSGADPPSITIDTRQVPVRVVGYAEAFPGMSSLRPLVVVDLERFTHAFEFEGKGDPLNSVAASHELWIRGDVATAGEALTGLAYVPDLVLSAEEVKDIPHIAAVIDAFLVMNGLGLIAALLVVVAMLMYLQARQRAEIVSYGLSLRMGMRSTSHLVAVALEVAAILLIAFVTGVALAVVAARLTVPLIDPIAVIPPPPLTVVPVFLIGAVAPVLLLVAFAGGWLTERRARAADLGQVMRLAD